MSTETPEESKLILQIEQERGNTPVTDSNELVIGNEYDVIEYFEDGGKFTIKKAKLKDIEENNYFGFFHQYTEYNKINGEPRVGKNGEPIGETISILKSQIDKDMLNMLSEMKKNTQLLPLDAAKFKDKIALFKYPTPKKGFWRGGKKKSSYKKGCRKTKTAKRCRKTKTAKRCRKNKPTLCRK